MIEISNGYVYLKKREKINEMGILRKSFYNLVNIYLKNQLIK